VYQKCPLTVILIVLGLCFSAPRVRAAVITQTQGVFLTGDFAIGDDIADNYMPIFDPALGTLNAVHVTLDSTLEWGQPFLVAAIPPNATGIIQAIGGTFIYGYSNYWEIDAPPQYHSFRTYAEGFYPVFHIHELLSDEPSLYLDPANPEDLVIQPYGGDLCFRNCIVYFSDDARGFLSGTLITTFVYTPARSVPEPSSLLLFLTGGIASLAATGLATPHKPG
jgi:hypothetical protein